MTIALEGLTMNPNQGLVDMAKGNIAQRRKKALTDRQNNATVQYLRDSGYEKEAEIVARNPMMAQAVLSEVAAMRKGSIDAKATLQKEEAKEVAKARVELPAALNTAKSAISAYDDALRLTDEQLDEVLGGVYSRLPTFQAESAKVESILDMAGGKSAMAAFESLKGAGAITEAELMQARQANSRLDNRLLSPSEYRKALMEAKDVADNLFAVAQQRARTGNLISVNTPMPTPVQQGGTQIDDSEIKVLGRK